jgi:hypothetical protein
MDLNFLYSRHQRTLMQATASDSSDNRHRLRIEASGIARDIARFQRDLGAAAAAGWAIAS